MEKTVGSLGGTYRAVLVLSLLALGIMALKVNADTIDGFFAKKQYATTVKSDIARKSRKGELCIDGERYDSIKAPIYQGDAYGDSIAQAKSLRKYLRPYLKQKDFEQYTDILVAICAQESRFGTLDDRNWMQVKTYQGPEGIVSTKAGADHFIQVVKHAKKVKCKDMVAIIQAYNFGSFYLDYCMQHGGKDTPAVRSAFQAYEKGITGRRSYGDINYAEKILQRITE